MFAFVADNFFEVQKYMVLDGHIYTVMALMINGDVWEKLTAEDQEIVMQAAKDAGIVEKDAIRSSQAEQIKYLEEQGSSTRTPTSRPGAMPRRACTTSSPTPMVPT